MAVVVMNDQESWISNMVVKIQMWLIERKNNFKWGGRLLENTTTLLYLLEE
jgi:hypothetical protein